MSKNTFEAFWQRITVPLVLVLGLASLLAQLMEHFASQMSIRILAVSAVIISVCWSIYLARQKEPSLIVGGNSTRKYPRRMRITAYSISLATALVATYTFLPVAPYQLPKPHIMIVNDSDADIMVERMGEFYLSLAATPLTESQLASGHFVLKSIEIPDGVSSDAIHVPSKQNVDVDCHFLRPEIYRELYEHWDCEIRFVLRTKAGAISSSKLIPFQRD